MDEKSEGITMQEHPDQPETICRTDAVSASEYREKLSGIADAIISSCKGDVCQTHIDYEPIPSKDVIVQILCRLREVLFPGYFSREKIDPVNLKFAMGNSISIIFDLLSEQICHSIRHDCFRYELSCRDCARKGYENALILLESIPEIQRLLDMDVKSAYDTDPAAKSHDEIIFCYPGIFAITVYRIAHVLFRLKVPLMPRIMTEYAHGETGIDIHPGAQIGERFVIDHGTGVVIGETTVIGNGVRLYQGVTLGALSLSKSITEEIRYQKRHPTIEDDCIIYSGATILGGDTVIGKGAVIGGNVWITESVPPATKVMLKTPQLNYYLSVMSG